jgi:eukaryotic-like serine/threonine-protein kinase
MGSDDQDTSRDDPRLNEILADYLQAVESGQAIDVERYVREHIEYEKELREFFADKRHLDDLAGRDATVPAASDPFDAATLAPKSKTHLDAPTLVSVADIAAEAPRTGALVRYFGEYELLEEIAHGGMGVVYKARQVKLNRIVALKMILAGQFASKEDVQRFHTEAEAAAGLDHPGIVPIFEVGEHGGQHYFSMAFIDGQSLSARLADGPMPPREAAELVRKVAEAVQYAHEKGVIHRDLKPANVLLAKADLAESLSADKPSSLSIQLPASRLQPKITDFGLAKKTAGDSNLTGTGQILGTPSYMPPEQAAGRISQVRETADVYSLGAIFYATLTGRPPFQADNPLDTLLQVLEREPVAVRELNSNVPLDLETICLKCLEKDRRRRFQTAKDLAEELQRFLEGRPILSRPIGRPERAWRWCRRNPIIAGLITAVVLSLLIGTLVSARFAMVAQEQAAKELEQRKTADRHAALLHADRSLAYCTPDDPAIGIMWFTRSLIEANKVADQRLESLCRLQLSGWLESMPPLVAVLPTGVVLGAAFSEDGTMLHTSSDGSSLKTWNLTDRSNKESGIPGGAKTFKATFDPQGRYMAVSRLDHAIQCYDLRDNQPVGPLLIYPDRNMRTMRFVVFSPDGSRLLSISENTAVRLWHVATGESVELLPPGPSNTINNPSVAAFTADGSQLLVSYPNEVFSFNAASGQLIGPIEPLGKRLNGMAFSPDGSRLVTATTTEAQIWDAKTWRRIGNSWPITVSHIDNVEVVFSPDGKMVATGDATNVRLIDAAIGLPICAPMRLRYLRVWEGESIKSLAFSRDGSLLMAGGASANSCIWRVAPQARRTRVLTHQDVSRGEFSPDGRVVITGSRGRGAQLWDVSSGLPRANKLDISGVVLVLAFDSSGQRVVAGSVGNTARVWDVQDGAPLTPVLRHSNTVDDAAFAVDGQSLWTLSRDGRAFHWNLATGDLIGDPVICEPNKSCLVVCGIFGPLLVEPTQLRDLTRQGSVIVKAQTGGWAVAHPDGKSVWTGATELIRVELGTGKIINDPLAYSGSVGLFEFEGNRCLIVNKEDATANWLDLNRNTSLGSRISLNGSWKGTSKTMGVVPLVSPWVKVAGPSQWSPHSNLLAIGANHNIGGAVQFFDPHFGQQIGPPWLFAGHVQQVGFSREGRELLTILDNGTAIIQQAIEPISGSLEQVTLQSEIATGLTFNNDDAIRPLSEIEWNDRFSRLNEMQTRLPTMQEAAGPQSGAKVN